MKMNIRGIRVNKLRDSELLPAFPVFIDSWHEKSENINGTINDLGLPNFLFLMSFVLMVLVTCSAMTFGDQVEVSGSFMRAITVVGGVVAVILLVVAIFVSFSMSNTMAPFIETVNRVDELLKALGLRRGIADLPAEPSAILTLTSSLVSTRILEVKRLEPEQGISVVTEDLERSEKEAKELATVMRKKFRIDIGEFGHIYQAADEQIAKEKERKPATVLTQRRTDC